MTTITETERLIIREITLSDSDVMLALHSDPEVHIYLGNQTITSIKKIEKAILSLTQQYEKYGVGRWAMIDKSTSEFIGWTGLEYVTKEINNHKNFYDLGYRLLKKYWGKGYASESAISSLDYGFDALGLKEIFAMADVENISSNKVLTKVGLQYIETFDHEGVRHNWYRVKKSEY